MDSTRVTTRSKNATQHPGLLDQGSQRRSKTEAAAERQAKAKAKEDKAIAKAAGIKRVAEFEKADAEKNALDATPRAPPLRRTSSHAFIPLYAKQRTPESVDVKMSDASEDASENEALSQRVEDDETTDTEEAPPPKKKKKVTETVVPKAVKAPKVKVRDAIKAANVSQLDDVMDLDLPDVVGGGDFLDHELTPKKKSRSKKPTPAPESESDRDLINYLKPKTSKTPVIFDSNLDVDPVDERKRGKGSGHGKKMVVQIEDSDGDSDNAPIASRASKSNQKGSSEGSGERTLPKPKL